MSLVVSRFEDLSICPELRFKNDILHARTPFKVRLLSLGAYDREVEVHPKAGYVFLKRRRWWGEYEKHTIPFRKIAYVDYKFSRLPRTFAVSGVRAPAGHRTDATSPVADQFECFTVSLVLTEIQDQESKRSKRITLFRFLGEGSAITGLRGVLFGDTILDFAGVQEEESRVFAEALAELIGVPLGKPSPEPGDLFEEVAKCSACARDNAPHLKTCLYCGHEVVRT